MNQEPNLTIAVTGATGHLGRLVLSRLSSAAPGARTVALARDPARAEGLAGEVRAFDYDQPKGLEAALAGVDTLLLISSSEIGKRVAQHGAVIAAAKAVGVRRIVYTSLLHADVSPLSLADEHLATEAALRESDVPFTILRNGWYIENHTDAMPGVLAGGALLGSAGEGRISGAARADYADAAVAALTGEGHAGQVYELAGDAAYTLADLAAEVSRQTGREIPYRDLPTSEYAAALAAHGLPADIAGAIAGWDADAAGGALLDEGRMLSRLIGRPTTPISATVAEALPAN